MLIPILLHTPAWVYALFAALLWLGGRQLRDQTAPLWRVVLMPVAMVALAVYGVVAAFGQSPAGLGALAGWAVAAALLAALVLRRPLPAGTRYDAATRRLHQAGSWVPLALILAIFLTKYTVAVALVMQPELARQSLLAVAVSTLYGVFSGLFVGRALRLWRLARRGNSAAADGDALAA
ncbi:DUF6622 family protein [Xenophilus sp. Marseille-Q4582]|uniref:DUF6622 family protein n=1 Tax=Xenophilus sp. Marseille-Q4582 TaxID=2866600 RepID=UPI001CE3CE68|nr:DUF6622 family protein [Xenophilus sp. Marseille-Q4582]